MAFLSDESHLDVTLASHSGTEVQTHLSNTGNIPSNASHC